MGDELSQPMASAPAEREHTAEGPSKNAGGVVAACAEAVLRVLEQVLHHGEAERLASLGHQGVSPVHRDEGAQKPVQLTLHYFCGREDDFPLAKDSNDRQHVGERAARGGPLSAALALHLGVDVEQKGGK